MAHIKIYSSTKIDTDKIIPWLRFDYKCEDSDSNYFPNPTYEYFYDCDSELENKIDFTDKEWSVAYAAFIVNLHWIYGKLDAIKIDYTYNILDGELKNKNHPKYKEGYKFKSQNSLIK